MVLALAVEAQVQLLVMLLQQPLLLVVLVQLQVLLVLAFTTLVAVAVALSTEVEWLLLLVELVVVAHLELLQEQAAAQILEVVQDAEALLAAMEVLALSLFQYLLPIIQVLQLEALQ